jgi:predicted amidophosphoribosyltransferase
METKIEDRSTQSDVCSLCGGKVNTDWNYCPNCKGKIQKIKCNNCLKTLNANWRYCPYCKTLQYPKEIINKNIVKDSNDWIRGVLGS